MYSREIKTIRQVLPEAMAFPYYGDRESAWTLAQVMPEAARVADLRRGPAAKLLDRPVLRPVLARCGGTLRRRDVLAVAHADRAMQMPGLGPAGLAGIEHVFAAPWHDFELSFDTWGAGGQYWDQTTRQQANLVVQLGFPSDHANLMGRYLPSRARKAYECDAHPIRATGRPTLAWARLDIDPETGEALVEEVQSDWLRFAREQVDYLREQQPRSRQLASLERYEAGLVARYGKVWPRAMLLAALVVLRDCFAIRSVWMHQPVPGAILKRIGGTLPPRSLYTALPKAFCFAPTCERPSFLRKLPARVTKRLPKDAPLFWRLNFA